MLAQHVRDKNKRIIGTMVADIKDGTVHFGWSKYNRSKEPGPASKKKGMAIAQARLEMPKPCSHDIPFALRAEFTKFISRAKKYFRTEYIEPNFKKFEEK